MTFRERQHRLHRLLWILAALALVPFLMNVLDIGDFTAAGKVLYGLILLGFGIPALRLGLQHVRDLRRHAPGRG